MRRWRIATAALVACTSATAIGPGTEELADASFPVADRFDPTPRPLGAVTVIGDSVLFGSVVFDPNVGEQLAARGWGPVRVRGGGSYTTGYFAVGDQTRASFWIDRWQAQGWDAPNVIVNLGTNDSGLCRTDLACARAAILHVVDAIGPGRRIWWPKITRRPVDQRFADTWNLALDQLAAERDDFFTWDWPAVMRAERLRAGDNIHLDPAGYRRRSELIAAEFTRVVARGSRTGTDAPLPESPGAPSEFVPIGPLRIADTRSGRIAGRLEAGETAVFELDDHVPEAATAAAIYLTAVGPAARGFLTAWDCSEPRPTGSAVNYPSGRNRGAMTISSISENSEICVFSRSPADVVVDLQGAFVPAGSDALRLDPLVTPVRLLDTREHGSTPPSEPIEVGVASAVDDATVRAAAVSISAIAGDEPGFVTAYACGTDQPPVATLNHGPGEIVAGAAFVPVGVDGAICVATRTAIDVTVDLTGVFSAGGELTYAAVPIARMIDTRDATGGWAPIHGAGQTIDALVAAPGVAAVTGTLTLVEPTDAGHLRAWGCGARPDTANVNAGAGQVLANSLTTAVSAEGRLCVFARTGAGTVFDLSGWWAATP